MPGSSKVNGVWRTTTGLSVKVSGQWKTATSAFVKVGGQWRQWFASKIQDAFNRTSTSLGLGTADSGQIWSALRGNWRVSGSNTAISDDSAATYPIASVNLGSTDVKVQVDTSGGTGVAFWVSDAGSWWASYPRYTSSSSTTPITGTCYTSSRSVSVTRRGCYTQTTTSTPCGPGQQSTSSGACAGPFGGGTSCSGTSSPCSFTGSSGSCQPPATCCGSISCTNSTSTVSTCTYDTSDSCSGLNCTIPGEANCCGGTIVKNQSLTTTNYSSPECQSAGQCSGTIPGSTTTSYYPEESTAVGGPGCAPGDTQVSCTNSGCICNAAFVCCRTTTTTPSISCSCTYTTNYASYCSKYASSSTVTTRSCTCPVSVNVPQYWLTPGTPTSTCNAGVNYCYSSGCTPGGCCSGVFDASYSESVCDQNPSSCTGSGCNPGGCCSGISYSGGVTTTTYTTQLLIVSSVSGSVVSASSTNISTNTSGYTTVGSIYVSTTGNTISATAYAAANLGGGVVHTTTHEASNPTKGTSVGIIKAPSSGNQGSTVDNFLATI